MKPTKLGSSGRGSRILYNLCKYLFLNATSVAPYIYRLIENVCEIHTIITYFFIDLTNVWQLHLFNTCRAVLNAESGLKTTKFQSSI